MLVLGIETSCDETAAAVVEDGRRLLSNVVASSLDLHVPYGGVVPEIAARSHLEVILPVIDQALQDTIVPSHPSPVTSNKQTLNKRLETRDKRRFDPWDQIDAIAVTQGPGLLGSLLIGVVTARTLAIAKNKPLYGVNHVMAHPYASFITDTSSNFKHQSSKFKLELPKAAPKFPVLALIVSGGHTQLVLFRNHFDYKLLGQTADDAVGEAFDKVAKMLGLPYPGGPSIAKAALKGDSQAFDLPQAKMSGYNFSFSGLKTAVLRAAQSQSGHGYDFPSSKLPGVLNSAQKANLAASFQHVAVATLVKNLKAAAQEYNPRSIVVAGGVAANQALREAVQKIETAPATSRGSDRSVGKVFFPDTKLCTDNAAMVAALGSFMASTKQPEADPYSLEPEPNLHF